MNKQKIKNQHKEIQIYCKHKQNSVTKYYNITVPCSTYSVDLLTLKTGELIYQVLDCVH